MIHAHSRRTIWLRVRLPKFTVIFDSVVFWESLWITYSIGVKLSQCNVWCHMNPCEELVKMYTLYHTTISDQMTDGSLVGGHCHIPVAKIIDKLLKPLLWHLPGRGSSMLHDCMSVAVNLDCDDDQPTWFSTQSTQVPALCLTFSSI